MKKYFCNPCGYTYDPEKGDPEHGIAPGTAFEDIPDTWCCPICGVTKDMFQPCIDNYNGYPHRLLLVGIFSIYPIIIHSRDIHTSLPFQYIIFRQVTWQSTRITLL